MTSSMTVMSRGMNTPASLPLWLDNSGVHALLSSLGPQEDCALPSHGRGPLVSTLGLFPSLPDPTSYTHILGSPPRQASALKAFSAKAATVMMPRVEDSWGIMGGGDPVLTLGLLPPDCSLNSGLHSTSSSIFFAATLQHLLFCVYLP